MNFSNFLSRSEDPKTDRAAGPSPAKHTGGRGKDENISYQSNFFYANAEGSVISNARKNLRAAKTRENVSKAEPFLLEIWNELENHISEKHKAGGEADYIENLSQEELLFEVKGTLSMIRTLNAGHDHRSLSSSAQESTILSLKRQLREERARSSVLERGQKDLKVQRRKLEDALIVERTALEAERDRNGCLAEEVEDLRKRNDDIKVLLSNTEEECVSLKTDRARMDELVTSLRGDVVDAHNVTAAARLKARQAEEHCEQLKDRIARERTGNAAVINRIKELQAIQEEISETVLAARTGSGDKRTTQRALASLGEQRVHLIGRIAHLLTRGRNSSGRGTDRGNVLRLGNNEDEVETGSHRNDGSGRVDNWDRKGESSFSLERGRNETENVNAIHTALINEEADMDSETEEEYDDNDRGGVLSSLNGLRKIGSGMQRKRQKQRTMRCHAERIHRLVKEDVGVLTAIVEKKNGEVEMLEGLLDESRKKVYLLEETLQEEKKKKKVMKRVANSENFTMKNHQGSSIASSSSRTSRTVAERGTIFDWRTDSTLLADEI